MNPDSSRAMMKVTCAGCGRQREVASAPLAANFQFYCKSCLSSQRKRLKYLPNVEAQRRLKERLEEFVELPLRGHEEDWFRLCTELGIDCIGVQHLVAIIREGKWRGSTSPIWFLKTKVSRCVANDTETSSFFDDDGVSVTVSDWVGFGVDSDGMHLEWDPGWRAAEKRKAGAWASLQEPINQPTSDDWRAAKPLLRQYWDKDELEVIKARSENVSRDRYLALASSPHERLTRQAAWRRVDRKGLPPELRIELRQGSETRLESPEWEDRSARDDLSDQSEDFNELDWRSSYGTGGGRRTKATQDD